MESWLDIISSARLLKWLMKITLVVGIILFDNSAALQAFNATVGPPTEITQRSSHYGGRTLSFKEAHNRFSRSFFLAIQIVKGFIASIFLYDTDVRTSVKIARGEFAMQKANSQSFYTYFFIFSKSEESHSLTQLQG